MGIAYVSANDTFLIWMLKTNQSIEYQNALNGAMNAANDMANTIFLTTNAAYNNANVGLVSANAYAGFMVNTAMDYAGVMSNSSNSYANTVGNSGNAYSVVIGTSGNVYTNLSVASANAYANFVGISSNTWSNTYSNAVGVNANTYCNVSTTSSNAYAGFMANSANAYVNSSAVALNAYSNVVGFSGNSYANFVGASANAYVNLSTSSANAYAGFMANSSNAYAYTLAYGALSGAAGFSNGVGISANAYTNLSTQAANNYAGVMANSANGFAASLAFQSGSGSNAYTYVTGLSGNNYTNLSTFAANVYAGVMANSSNAWANNIAVSTNAYINVSTTSANNYANATFLKIAGGTVTGDLVLSGNLFFSGNATTVYSTQLTVGDSLIYLAANNYGSTDTLDIGFIGNYSNGTSNVHTGLYRSSANKQYYLFQGYDIEPGANNKITPYANNMVNAVLVADFNTSNLTLGGANAITWITGISTNTTAAFAKANGVSSGANGFAITVGTSGNAYATSVGASGNVYAQVVGTSGNAYALSTATSIGAAGNVYAQAVGAAANAYTAATYAPLGGSGASGQWNIRAYPRRSDGGNIDIIYSGQSGQPSWLVGTNDGTSFYVYNPSNFSVSTANAASYCNGYQFNQSVKTDGTPTFSTINTQVMYDSNDNGYYVDPASTSRINTINASYLYSYGDIRAAGYIYAVGRVVVGEGATSSMIEMRDTDESVRYIHNNSGTIGFLNSSGTWRFRMSDSGDLYMGAYQDWLSTQIQSNAFKYKDNTGYYCFNGNANARLGNVYVDYLQSYGTIYSNGNITAYSDRILKTNIETIVNAVDILNSLRGVTFDWVKTGKKSIGVIAQEVEKVLPELVEETTDFVNGEERVVKSVDYGKIVSVLIEGWKVHEKEIADLKNQLAELSKK